MVKAQLNPDKNYLQIQSFVCHGYNLMGFQCVPTSNYDPLTKNFEIIPVEKLIRGSIRGVSNVYCLVFFACCREIRKDLQESLCSGIKDYGGVGSGANFILSFGCAPGCGIIVNSNYIKEMTSQIAADFNQTG